MRIIIVFTLLVFTGLRAMAFEFNDVRAMAQKLASKPHQPSTNRVPESLVNLSYDDHQGIRFDHRKALWRAERLPVWVEFFFPGAAQKDVVLLHEVNNEGVRRIPFKMEDFGYGERKLEVPPGFAGFSMIDGRKHLNEFQFAAFLGASYFRMAGDGQVYGTSARGLAVHTMGPGPEEFPIFDHFWIQRPVSNANSVTVFALMNSPSIAGAFKFVIQPGKETMATVNAALFPRRDITEFGLAPLTSMFLRGEAEPHLVSDPRPEVHDADGLLVHNHRNEWIWRPLEAGAAIRENTFMDDGPRGFGLLQRDSDFEHYQDRVAHYDRRVNVWVKPLGDWGPGIVRLIQLPSGREYFDNIVAYWQPAKGLRPGVVTELEYELRWGREEVSPNKLGRVTATYVERGKGGQSANPRFLVDFEGLSAFKNKLKAKVEHDVDVKLITCDVIKSETNDTVRLAVEIAKSDKPVDLRAYLVSGKQRKSEIWAFTWRP